MSLLKKIFIAVSSIWLAVDIALVLYALHSFQYPFNASNIEPVVAILFFPALALLLSIIYKGNKKIPTIIFSVILGIVLALQFYMTVPNFFNSLYYSIKGEGTFSENFDGLGYNFLFRSETEDIENYLDIEDMYSYDIDIINKYFPETIPENAIYPEYSYSYFEFFFTTESVRASWEFSKDDFEKELVKEYERMTGKTAQTSSVTYKYDEEKEETYIVDNDGNKSVLPYVRLEEGKIIFEYENGLINVSYDESTHRVEYSFEYTD